MKQIIKRSVSLILLCSMLLALTGCGSENGRKYTVYYTNSTANKLVEKQYTSNGQSATQIMNDLVDQMNTKQKQDDYVVIKPDNVAITNIRVDANTANVFYNKEYKDMSNSVELLYRAAMVKTLTQVDGIDYVRFYVDDNPVEYSDGTVVGIMSAADFVDDSNEQIGSIKWKDLNLYYSNKLGDKLVKTSVSVAYNKNVSLEKMIVEKLINGPSDSAMLATLPPDIKLLSISVNNRVCYVNLSATFLTEMVNVSNEIPIYSIVNSLCDLDTVDSVKIMINGDSNKTYRESISLDTTFVYNDTLLSPQN